MSNYPEYRDEIEKITKEAGVGPRLEGQDKSTTGVQNVDQAITVLNNNKIPLYMNAGRKIGLVTGINPQRS